MIRRTAKAQHLLIYRRAMKIMVINSQVSGKPYGKWSRYTVVTSATVKVVSMKIMRVMSIAIFLEKR